MKRRSRRSFAPPWHSCPPRLLRLKRLTRRDQLDKSGQPVPASAERRDQPNGRLDVAERQRSTHGMRHHVSQHRPTKDIEERGRRAISMMPEGLADNLTIRELASVLAYLESLNTK